MRRLALLPLLLLLVLALCTLPASARKADRRAELQQIAVVESEWRRAQLAGDVPAMDRLLADDFLGITAAGKVVTKAQQLERMRTRAFSLSKLNVSDEKIKLAGSMAVVTSLAEIDGNSGGQPIHGRFRYTRVYQRSAAGAWRITSFEATVIKKGPRHLMASNRS